MSNVRFEQMQRIDRAISRDVGPKTREVTEATAQALILCAVPLMMRLHDVRYDTRLVEEVVQAGWLAMCQTLEDR